MAPDEFAQLIVEKLVNVGPTFGLALPIWEDLPDKIQACAIAAADAVLSDLHDGFRESVFSSRLEVQ